MLKAMLAAGLFSLALAAPAGAEVQLRIQMGFPTVLPPLVEVEPGISVVQDYDQEIFFTGGYYWVMRDGSWYRSRDHQGYWRMQDRGRVPPGLYGMHPGQYRRWQHDDRRAWPRGQGNGPGVRHWGPADRRDRPAPRAQPAQRQPAQHEQRAPQQRGDGNNGRGRGSGRGDDHERGR
jgi:hypothetical protein